MTAVVASLQIWPPMGHTSQNSSLLPFLPHWVWTDSMTRFNQQNEAEVMWGQFWTYAFGRLRKPGLPCCKSSYQLVSPHGRRGSEATRREKGQPSPGCHGDIPVPSTFWRYPLMRPSKARPAEDESQTTGDSWEIINCCCFKALSFWVACYVATENWNWLLPGCTTVQVSWNQIYCWKHHLKKKHASWSQTPTESLAYSNFQRLLIWKKKTWTVSVLFQKYSLSTTNLY